MKILEHKQEELILVNRKEEFAEKILWRPQDCSMTLENRKEPKKNTEKSAESCLKILMDTQLNGVELVT